MLLMNGDRSKLKRSFDLSSKSLANRPNLSRGGKICWNTSLKLTSTVFGHPAKAKLSRQSVFLATGEIDFGINFENDGLRVKAQLERMKMKL